MSQTDGGKKKRPNILGTIALLVVGLVILVPSGLCTGIMGGGALLDTLLHPMGGGDMYMATLALVIGGPFVALGSFMVYKAIKRMRAG